MHPRNTPLSPDVLDTLFHEARTHHGWVDRPVEDALLRQLWSLVRMSPTALNASPVRLVFVKSPEAKERLKPCLDPANVEKTMTAPVTVIVAYDTRFHEHLPRLFPARDMKTAMEQRPPEAREQLASVNGTLQAAYLILAARALGLDCGPMGGFNKARVDETFLVGTSWKSLLLINLGYGDSAKLRPRAPRLDFEDACRIE